MKLNELGARRPTETITQVFESHLGRGVKFDSLGPIQVKHMLRRVRSLVNEHKSSTGFYTSQQNPNYLKLVMMEQALTHRLSEQMTNPMTGGTTGVVAVDVKDPKTVATMKKAQAGQTLNPDEQKTITAIASMPKKESAAPKRMVRESELQAAQVVLAGQDMVDQIQKMIEQISEMQFKDLPALVASIKNDMGSDEGNQYQEQATQALQNLLQSIQQGKNELESAQSILSGEQTAMPGLDGNVDVDADIDNVPSDDMDQDLDLDANLDIDADIEEPKDSPAVLGRNRR